MLNTSLSVSTLFRFLGLPILVIKGCVVFACTHVRRLLHSTIVSFYKSAHVVCLFWLLANQIGIQQEIKKSGGNLEIKSMSVP